MGHLLNLTRSSFTGYNSEELCRFCLVPINLEAIDIIQPCSCKTNTKGALVNRIYGYCHTECLTDYRIQRADNECYIKCEDCKTHYNFITAELNTVDGFIFSMKVNRGVRYFLWVFWVLIYIGFWTTPIFGFMVLWRYTNKLAFPNLLEANDLNLGTWFPYYLLGSLTWGTILGLYWCCCARGCLDRLSIVTRSIIMDTVNTMGLILEEDTIPSSFTADLGRRGPTLADREVTTQKDY